MNSAPATLRAPKYPSTPPVNVVDALVLEAMRGNLNKGLVQTLLRIAREETVASDARIRSGL